MSLTGTSNISPPKLKKSRLLRGLLITVGWLSVILGVIGIFLPLLPTTPFLLLAAACFLRSSEAFYQWLVEHPSLSRYLVPYLSGQGLPRKAKIYTSCIIFGTMTVSALFIPLWQVIVMMYLIGVAVSIYLWRLPDYELTDESS